MYYFNNLVYVFEYLGEYLYTLKNLYRYKTREVLLLCDSHLQANKKTYLRANWKPGSSIKKTSSIEAAEFWLKFVHNNW